MAEGSTKEGKVQKNGDSGRCGGIKINQQQEKKILLFINSEICAVLQTKAYIFILASLQFNVLLRALWFYIIGCERDRYLYVHLSGGIEMRK